ncbi:hypothetical protein EMCRGX_G032130 [Ephydatia muelleri]
MSSERLEGIETKVNVLVQAIQDELSYQLPRKNGDDRRRSIQSLERRLGEAEELVNSAVVEVKKAPLAYQKDASARVAQYRRTLASLKRQLNSGSDVREELFKSESDSPAMAGAFLEHDQLLQKTETMRRASESLKRAQQVSEETDQIGIEIIEDLSEQKESLLRTRSRLQGIDEDLDTTKTLLRRIVCKTIQNSQKHRTIQFRTG